MSDYALHTSTARIMQNNADASGRRACDASASSSQEIQEIAGRRGGLALPVNDKQVGESLAAGYFDE